MRLEGICPIRSTWLAFTLSSDPLHRIPRDPYPNIPQGPAPYSLIKTHVRDNI